MGADSHTGVSMQEVNLGRAPGKSACESQGKGAGLGRGRNPAARQSQGSTTADSARFYIPQSLCDTGAPGRGCGPHGQVTLLTRGHPQTRLTAAGHLPAALPAAGVFYSQNKSFITKGECGHLRHTITAPIWQDRAQCPSPPP